MTLDEELNGLAAHAASDDEIARVLPCEAFTRNEVGCTVKALAGWRDEGRVFRLWRDEWPEGEVAGEALAHLLWAEAERGILPFRAYDLGTDFRLCKVLAGRGLFGGKRVRFHWYLSTGEGEFVPASSSGNLISALAQVGSIYRAHGA